MTFTPLPSQGSTSWYGWGGDVHNALNDSTSSAAAGLRAGFGLVVTPEAHGAVGDGTTDDTTAVQAALDGASAGATVLLSASQTYRCTTGLTVSKKLQITGGGTLKFTAGLTANGSSTALAINSDGCVISGITLTNPNLLKPTTTFGAGGNNFGIRIRGNDVAVLGCTVDSFMNGIAVAEDGEWQRCRIIGNRIKDVLGAGGGSADSTTLNGEDRGDGIVVWGSQAVVADNVVNCKTGSDGRIGIHFEALSSAEGTHPAHSDEQITITGNVVYGQFRRGIVAEDTAAGSIAGNTVADSTWWAIAVVRGTGFSVTGNTIIWTRTTADTQGSALNPDRAPLCVFGSALGVVLADNTVRSASTSAADCYVSLVGNSTSDMPTDVRIRGNVLGAASGAVVTIGLKATPNTLRLAVTDNTIGGFADRGVFLFGADRYAVRGNTIVGIAGTSTYGVDAGNATATGGVIDNNEITGCNQGIQRSNGTGTRITGNRLENCVNGIDGFGCSNSLVADNIIGASGTKIGDITNGTGGNVVVNNV